MWERKDPRGSDLVVSALFILPDPDIMKPSFSQLLGWGTCPLLLMFKGGSPPHTLQLSVHTIGAADSSFKPKKRG